MLFLTKKITDILHRKFAIKWSAKIQSHPECVATLPCEIHCIVKLITNELQVTL